ncbi:MAG: hypothetical protein U0670_24610 [Anaerolineae bacterium]
MDLSKIGSEVISGVIVTLIITALGWVVQRMRRPTINQPPVGQSQGGQPASIQPNSPYTSYTGGGGPSAEQPSSGTTPSGVPAYGTAYSSPQGAVLASDSWRATASLGLALLSVPMWVVVAPLVLPAIALSIWFGLSGRRSRNRSQATFGLAISLIHTAVIVLLVVLVVVGVINQIDQPSDFSNFTSTSGFGYCVTNFGSCPMNISLPNGSQCICYDGFGNQASGVVSR